MSEPATVKVNPDFTGGKTIRQIAAEIGVSRQAVHQKRKSKELSATLQPFTSIVNGAVYISADGEALIKKAFASSGYQRVEANKAATVESSVYGVLKATIDTLQEQLVVKDEQLAAKDAQIAEITSALLSAQQTVQAAQALHAGTIQTQLRNSSNRGIFSRVFGKRNRNAKPDAKMDT
ncbi:MAG: hypothetical protein LBN43_05740 [Oscillospiraceae bacterium]|jgi:hypothetical protein|nr:hypothetical protein [Oscillospiraceae bacterium]